MKKVLLAALLLPIWLAPATAQELKFVTEQFPPFTYEQDGHAAGPLADTVTALCAELKKTCTQQVLPWRRALQGAEDGEFQGIYSAADTPERNAKFFLLPPILKTSYSFVVPNDSTWTYQGPSSLKAQEVSVYGPSSTSTAGDELIKQSDGGKMKMEISNDNVVRQLGAHHATIGLINRDVGEAIMKTNGIADLKFVGDAKVITYTVGLSRKGMSEADAQAFAEAFKKLNAEGKIKEIVARYNMRSAQ